MFLVFYIYELRPGQSLASPSSSLWCNVYLGQGVVPDDGGVVDVAQVARPRPDGADVEAEVLLVWRRAERKRMVLTATEHRTRDANPLTRLVLEVGGPLDMDGGHIWRNIAIRNETTTFENKHMSARRANMNEDRYRCND